MGVLSGDFIGSDQRYAGKNTNEDKEKTSYPVSSTICVKDG